MTSLLKHNSLLRPIAVPLAILLFVVGGQRAIAQSPTQLQQLRDAEAQILKHIDRMRAATVGVKLGTANASGFVIDGGFVVTSAHATNRIGQRARVFLLNKSERAATVHAIDHSTDVALLKLNDASGLQTVPFRRGAMRGLNRVVAIGNPGGFDKERPSLVRYGAARGSDVLQSTCRIARGDSGGPLFDLSGRVVGVHRQIRIDARENYHTSAVAVRRNWKRLIQGGVIEGNAPSAGQFKFARRHLQHAASRSVVEVRCGGRRVALGTVVHRERGLIVSKASELTKPVTIAFGEQRVPATIVKTDRKKDLALLRAKADWPAELRIEPEDGEAKVGQFVLTVRPGQCVQGVVAAAARPIAPKRGEVGLVLAGNLEVEQVQPNSAAKAAGFKPGDLVQLVGGRPVVTTDDFGLALRPFEAGDVVEMIAMRETELGEVVQSRRVRLRHPAGSRFDDKTFQLGAGGVSSQRRTGFPSVLQHDCLVTADECGSPVIDLDGRFIGINVAKVGREAIYCVPVGTVRELVTAVKTLSEPPSKP